MAAWWWPPCARAATGIRFKAGPGVGMVTKGGLADSAGRARHQPRAAPDDERSDRASWAARDAEIEISIPGGEALAEKTWNPRLGIVGRAFHPGHDGHRASRSPARPGSPRSTAASTWRGPWGLPHVAGCTGSTSEDAVRAHYGLPLEAMLDMGDFAGGLLKYLRDASRCRG